MKRWYVPLYEPKYGCFVEMYMWNKPSAAELLSPNVAPQNRHDAYFVGSWQWRHNERDGVLNHQPHDCLLKRLFNGNIKAPRHWPLWGHRWIPHTKGQ